MDVLPARRLFTGEIVFNPAVPVGFVNAGEREALGRLTSASPYSSIKVSNTSLDHLLLGKAADWVIIRYSFAAWQICVREPNRLTGIWEPHSDNPVSQELGDAGERLVGFEQSLRILIPRQPARFDRREKRASATPSISLDSTLAAGSLCPGLEKRTTRESEGQIGISGLGIRRAGNPLAGSGSSLLIMRVTHSE